LVSAVSAAGDALLAWSARLVVMLTTWPASWMSVSDVERSKQFYQRLGSMRRPSSGASDVVVEPP
jgi:hypothetical protein